jgi:hypothetical protein
MANPFILFSKLNKGRQRKKITEDQQQEYCQVTASDPFWKIKLHKEYS